MDPNRGVMIIVLSDEAGDISVTCFPIPDSCRGAAREGYEKSGKLVASDAACDPQKRKGRILGDDP